MKRMMPAVAVALLAGCAPAGGTTWHVDYASGRDSADGRTPATAWKHAPGDPDATAGPAGARLQPGDKLLFRAGVAYRGTIRVAASGNAEKPIVYSGIGWGEGLAIIEGADPVASARPCTSAADCGGAADWKALSRVEYPQPATARVVLYGARGPYWLSQIPAPADPFYSDGRHGFAVTPLSRLGELQSGILTSPELARAARDGRMVELAFWVRPNLVTRRPLKGIDGDRLLFDAEGLRFYEDRDGAVALNGSFAGLAEPGRYVVIGPGVLVARLRPGDNATTLSIGSGRMGFNVTGQSNLVISGFHFRNMTGSATGRREGRAITSLGIRAHDIEISGNRFGPAVIENGSGVVQLQAADNVDILSNRIEEIAFGSGIRASGGKPSNLRIEGNVIRRLGRTGIALLGVHGAQVKGNIVADIRGVHGNALTAYLGNRDILFEGNCVVNSSRPLTYHGDKNAPEPNRLVIRHNILVSTPDGQAAINSWGSNTQDVRIEGNLLIGPKMGLLMNQSDRDVVVRGNDTSGISTRGEVPPDWTLDGNREDLNFASIAKASFTESGCAVPGTRVAPVERAQPKGRLAAQPQ